MAWVFLCLNIHCPVRNGVPGVSPSRRTAAQAVQQADAKDRIRTARSVRATGPTLIVGGLGLLVRPETWRRPFATSLSGVLGLTCLVLGPVAFAVGSALLRRATARAQANPVTAEIFSQMEAEDRNETPT